MGERPGLVLRSSRPLHSFCLLRFFNVTEYLQGMACFYVSFIVYFVSLL